MDKKEYISLVLTVVPVVVLIFLWNYLPDQIPIHWNFNGEIDGYGPKYLVILIILPAYLLTRFASRSIPDQFKLKWSRIRVFLMAFLSVISLGVLIAGMGFTVPMVSIAIIGILALSVISLI